MRLFIAYPLTSGVLAKIGFLEEKTNKKLKTKLNWIPLKNLHLTILFLGNINLENYLKLEEVFKESPDFSSFDIKVKKLDFGPPGKKRMIWLYIEKNKNLEEIKNYFEKKLEEKNINYHRENRDYLPHVNLLRLKDKSFSVNSEIKEELNWTIRINEIALFQSFLKSSGAEYEKIFSLSLLEKGDML